MFLVMLSSGICVVIKATFGCYSSFFLCMASNSLWVLYDGFTWPLWYPLYLELQGVISVIHSIWCYNIDQYQRITIAEVNSTLKVQNKSSSIRLTETNNQRKLHLLGYKMTEFASSKGCKYQWSNIGIVQQFLSVPWSIRRIFLALFWEKVLFDFTVSCNYKKSFLYATIFQNTFVKVEFKRAMSTFTSGLLWQKLMMKNIK